MCEVAHTVLVSMCGVARAREHTLAVVKDHRPVGPVLTWESGDSVPGLLAGGLLGAEWAPAWAAAGPLR